MNQPPSRRRKKATPAASDDSTLPNDLAEENISPQENPALAIIDVTAVEIPELTEQEISDRLYLERKVERAFFEAGKALMELRDRRLYRSTHKTFEEYCRSRFGYTRMAATYKIAAATVMENLSTIGLQNAEITTDGLQPTKMSTIGLQNVEMSTIGLQILPTNERQVRPLVALEPEVQRTAWQQAVQVAGGKVPTGRIVKDVVQRIMERTQVPNTYQIGEVCQILAKDNPELRGKGGCWAIVSAINNFSCSVRMWNGEYAIGLQHLKSYNYLPAECEQMRVICDRIGRVYSSGLEESVQKFLEMLGKLNRAYLTDLEEKVLSLLELEIIP
ncbi:MULTISPECIES: hypothetical protein [Nostoc]|uniref:Uncharacterized protein n=2 Tax=Nostoc TaxID=1177 RepID=A0ABR8IHS1_9NOSO|nr:MULTISPECIES: hypothetical protein [Nostoc]MBD2563963.1 hypothetical protein [Nostoc linckia FACHB-391]MBD2650449.1 hypothetical protein [Nostoc foliaceum FACHB-393]